MEHSNVSCLENTSSTSWATASEDHTALGGQGASGRNDPLHVSRRLRLPNDQGAPDSIVRPKARMG